jgi:bifunctional UDP-N-acetylglucosamine pyrophosphorylase/glucosamine-1-phosphate N-acetyltransferase
VARALVNLKAIVLAAGEGRRLRPFTLTRPKCMLPVANKPILEHLVANFKEWNVNEVIIVVGYRKEKVFEYFKSAPKLPVKLQYAVQKEALGTASALSVVESMIEDDRFLVLYGDLLVDGAAVSIFLEEASGGDTLVAAVRAKDLQRFGVLEMKNDEIARIVEKPMRKAPNALANAGIYVFSRSIFKAIKHVKRSFRGEFELIDAINWLIKGGERVVAVEIPQEGWMDVGHPWDLLKANERVLKRTKLELKGEVEGGAVIKGEVGIAEKTKILSGAYIEGPTSIGENCIIGPNCYIRPYTSIGDGVRVGNACEVKNSIIMGGTKIAHLSYVADSVIGFNCNFGAGTIIANLRFDDETVKVNVQGKEVDSGLRKLGAFIGDGVKTGVGSSLMPGVKVGPNCWIWPNLVVFKDVPPSTRLTRGSDNSKGEKKW